MGLKDLQLIFDNPQNIYFGGQTVTGRLVVQTDTPKKLRSIMVKFKGEAECSWSERITFRRNGKTERDTIHYRGHEIYFDNRQKVFGGTGNTEVLQAGEHCFQFSTMLPNILPSSFEGRYGHVRYTVKATLDRPWKFDHEVKAAFTVISHLDLNLVPQNRESVKFEDNKYFGCCCCKSGPLTMVTHLPARGYVPGQSISMTIEVDNASKLKIYKVVCELNKIVTYRATSHQITYRAMPRHGIKQESVLVTEVLLDGSVEENNSKTWASRMVVPPLPPSTLPHCNIIDVEYNLVVKAEPEGLHRNLKNSIPITIGTIPLWQSSAVQQGVPYSGLQQPMPTPPSLQEPMPAPSAPSSDMVTGFTSKTEKETDITPSAPYPDMPPPTYEECVFGTTSISDSDDNKHIFGTTAYNPRYPTYSLQSTVPGNPAIGWASPK